ncbi:MAG: DUF1836 domain-containing protein [Sporomusaceae bacterium]|nr:DUF1836 domain-containing protein [Sporomusaceae bacterium]
MEFGEIREIIDGLGLTEEIPPHEIPELELYMDQVLEFLNARLDWLKREELDKGLTKMMINNYTKAQLLIPPKNRKYGKHHIMLLILICQLKSVLSIEDIKTLFSPILNDITTPDDDVIPLEKIYTIFLELQREQFSDFQEIFAEKAKYIENKLAEIETPHQKTAKMFLVVLMLVAQAGVSKRLAEKIIDAYFPKPGQITTTGSI